MTKYWRVGRGHTVRRARPAAQLHLGCIDRVRLRTDGPRKKESDCRREEKFLFQPDPSVRLRNNGINHDARCTRDATVP